MISSENIKIFILNPTFVDRGNASKTLVANHNSILANEYGKSDGIKDISQVLVRMGFDVEIVNITLENFEECLDYIENDDAVLSNRKVVFQLCDGLESDGFPGISVVQSLQSRGMSFTGAGDIFYLTTTSKPDLKRACIENHVPTGEFVEINVEEEIEGQVLMAEAIVGYPMIVKPSVSYASLDITDKSIVLTRSQTIQQCREVLQNQQQGGGGVFLESFLAGREFTALVTGDERHGIRVYDVAERVFNKNLKTFQRILAFDRYWDGFTLDGCNGTQKEPLYWYEKAPEQEQEQIKAVALKAYIACNGSGYGRVDMRTRTMDDYRVVVLEVNANCGLTFDKDASSLGQILHLSRVDPSEFVQELINYARCRERKSRNTN